MDIRENAYFHTLLRLLRARPASPPPCSPVREGRKGSQHNTRSRLCGMEPRAVDSPREVPRALSMRDELWAVPDVVGNALRPLADTAAIVGEVVHDVFR